MVSNAIAGERVSCDRSTVPTRFFTLTALRYALATRLAPELLARAEADLALENLALRQQLAAVLEKRPRPRLTDAFRRFWVFFRRWFPSSWRNALVVVKPDTVVAWHRAGFRLYWRLRSGHGGGGGRKPLRADVRALIDRMVRENNYRAIRIHGELMKLGIVVSERTVTNYLKKRFPYPEDRLQQWRAFLRNEAVAAMDFTVIPTASYTRFIYAFIIIAHGRRKLIHVNAVESPNAEWVAQQLREAFPGGEPMPRYLVHDGDTIFCSKLVQATIKGLGIQPSRTAYHCPWQNGICERFMGTLKRELTRRVIIFDDRHLAVLLHEYAAYYNAYRTHLTLNKDSPLGRPVLCKPYDRAEVVSISHLGGLHHHYEWASDKVAAKKARDPFYAFIQ